MAKVSIIIPTYNVEMYLVECMESVVNQTLKDIEIICINDGSTDGSLEILKSYAQKDDRIVLVDKENGGYGIGMNIGLDKATGEYIGIVEPDDFIPLNMYSDLYEKAVENDLDFIKADFYRFKRDSETEDMELVYNHLSPNKEDYNVVFNPSETPGASFQDNGFWFQTFVYAKRGMIIDTPYYMNRRDNPNSSVHNKEKVYCMNVEYDHIRELLVRDKEVWERFRPMYWLKKYNNYMGTIKRIGEEYKREYVHRFSEEFKRGLELGELDESVFTKISWDNIQFITKDPNGFYMKKVATPVKVRRLQKKVEKLEKQNAKLKNDIKIIKGSRSYRLGWFLLTIPRKIKAIFKGNK